MNTTSLNTSRVDHCIKVCNGLLRGELSAADAYGQAIDKHRDSPGIEELRRIRAEHVSAASRLNANVREMGGEPERDAGAWGIFATAVQGAANLFGTDSAVESLKQGEQFGLRDYEAALVDDEVMPDCKALISEQLLPPVRQHIAALEQLARSS